MINDDITDDGTMPSGSCCSPPKGPSHGTYPLNKDVVQGETTTLVCDNGYSPNGTDVISCGANHLWSNGGSCLLGNMIQSLMNHKNNASQIKCLNGHSFYSVDIGINSFLRDTYAVVFSIA